MMPTLHDIAKAAGVHHSTVSRALRGHPRISEKRTKQLRELAEQMGYIPDPMLNALMAYRTRKRPVAFQETIAWFNPDLKKTHWLPYKAYMDYFAGATARARELGFHLEEIIIPFTLPPAADPKHPRAPVDVADGKKAETYPGRMMTMLEARNIRAIIVGPTPVAGMVLDQINWQRFSAVSIGHSLASPKLHTVTTNHFQAMTDLIGQLHLRGYRRPGLFITEALDMRTGKQWSAAFLREQFGFLPKNRLPPCWCKQYATSELITWVRKARPDVVIGVGDSRVVDALRSMGLRVPQDIGFAVLAQPNHQHSAMTGVVERNAEIGIAAVNFVVAMINRQERSLVNTPQMTFIQNGWLEADTLRPPP